MSREGRPTDPALEQPDIIEVEMEEWKLAGDGAVIETTGLGPCTGVIMYDTKSKRALVGHFVDPRRPEFQEMLAKAQELFDPATTQVHVGGGSPDLLVEEFEPGGVKAARAFVPAELKRRGFTSQEIRYQDSSDQSTVLRVDTATGAVEYDTEDIG